jgi:VWFA-related protein
MTIRQTVRRVIVDVTVQDANGKPVHGLTANDFSVTEDKQPQRVLSFDVYDFDKPSISRGPNAPALPPNLFVNVPMVPERGPLYVMLYDLVNTGNQMWATPQILKFIRSKPAGTRFAIFVNSDGLYLLQGFTDDKGLLYAALDPNHPKHHMPRVFLYARNYGAGNACTAVDVLTHIGKYLDGIPGRKNLIWASDLFPLPLGAEEGDSACRDTEVQAELNALAQAQVAIFPLEP